MGHGRLIYIMISRLRKKNFPRSYGTLKDWSDFVEEHSRNNNSIAFYHLVSVNAIFLEEKFPVLLHFSMTLLLFSR